MYSVTSHTHKQHKVEFEFEDSDDSDDDDDDGTVRTFLTTTTAFFTRRSSSSNHLKRRRRRRRNNDRRSNKGPTTRFRLPKSIRRTLPPPILIARVMLLVLAVSLSLETIRRSETLNASTTTADAYSHLRPDTTQK
eukprot:8034140-Ditylum_brightwellii.AAC.1